MTIFDKFLSEEHSFSETFAQKPVKILRMGADAPVQSLSSVEVPQSAGFCSFTEKDLKDRFIIWRSDGPTLNLEEYSVERNLSDASLSMTFSQSKIIPGIRMMLHRRMLLLFVPTQSAIHRFIVHLSPDKFKPDSSILRMFYENDRLIANHDFHHFNINGIAIKASIGVSRSTSLTTAAICMQDKQLLKVTFQSLRCGQNFAEEVLLQGQNIFDKLFKKQTWPELWDIVVINSEDGDEHSSICSASRDGKLRIFGNGSNLPTFCANISDYFNEETKHYSAVSLRVVNFDGCAKDYYILLCIQLSDRNWFSLLEFKQGALVLRFNCKLDSKYVIDFTCSQDLDSNKCNLLAIVNELSFESEHDGGEQPYTLKRRAFSLDGSACEGDTQWENVRSATETNLSSLLLTKTFGIESIRNRIFDGNNFSFAIVSRAIQIVCPQQQRTQIEQGNWIKLGQNLDEYLLSQNFNRDYLSESDENLSSSTMSLNEPKINHAHRKFWINLFKTCNQLQEADLQPLSIWHSRSLGMVGVIQLCRFTVCIAFDPLIRAVCSSVDQNLSPILSSIPLQNVSGEAASYKFKEETALETFTNYLPELYDLSVNFFKSHSSFIKTDEFTDGLFSGRSDFLSSQFTIKLLASALLNRICGRLQLAHVLQKLFRLVPRITSLDKGSPMSEQIAKLVTEKDSLLSHTIHCYSTLWMILSSRLVSFSAGKDPFPKQINVAQAFFRLCSPSAMKIGPSSIDQNSNNRNLLDGNETINSKASQSQMAGIGEMEEDDDDVSSAAVYPSSRWDETVATSFHEVSRVAEKSNKSFVDFLDNTLFGTILSLWPDSKLMQLPSFLAENRFFDALKNYCELNEPFITELAYAFRFFQGIALSGLKRPDESWDAFSDVVSGIKMGDKDLTRILNDVLTRLNGGCESDGTRNGCQQYTVAQYYYKVMLFYKSHGHPRYAISAGEKAISSAAVDSDILPEIYSTMFTEHLLFGSYREAMRALLLNPERAKQLTCLHQLIGYLLSKQQADVLVGMYFSNLGDDVANILEAKCRIESTNDLPTMSTMYNITYAFHLNRCNYSRAAHIMHDLARRLKRLVQTREMLLRRCQLLATVFQTMQIVEDGSDADVLRYEVDDQEELKEFVAATSFDSEENGNGDVQMPLQQNGPKIVVFTVEDIGRELLKSEVRLALVDANPLSIPPIDDELILRESLKHKLYDMAWIFAREFELKPYDILEAVSFEAIRIDNEISTEVESEWMIFNRKFLGDSNQNYKLHWRVLISYTDMAMKIYPHDSKILRTIAYTFLKYSIRIPTWLESRYRSLDFGDFLRTLIDFGDLREAFVLLLSEIEVAKRRLKEAMTQRIQYGLDPRIPADEVDLLPYTHIDELIYLARKDNNNSALPKLIQKAIRGIEGYFRLQHKFRVPDPASQSIMGSLNGASSRTTTGF